MSGDEDYRDLTSSVHSPGNFYAVALRAISPMQGDTERHYPAALRDFTAQDWAGTIHWAHCAFEEALNTTSKSTKDIPVGYMARQRLTAGAIKRRPHLVRQLHRDWRSRFYQIDVDGTVSMPCYSAEI